MQGAGCRVQGKGCGRWGKHRALPLSGGDRALELGRGRVQGRVGGAEERELREEPVTLLEIRLQILETKGNNLKGLQGLWLRV